MIITSFDAKNGDAIHIRSNKGTNIFVDMGYPETYNNYLSKRIEDIVNNGGVIDLLVITHFDNDHISGAISFLNDIENGFYQKSILKQIWHNSYRHLSMATRANIKSEDFIVLSAYLERLSRYNFKISGNEISALQGSTLGAAVLKLGVKWNKDSPYEPISNGYNDIINDLNLTVLLPSKYNLKKLKRYWRSQLKKLKYDFEFGENDIFDDAFELYMKNEGIDTSSASISYGEFKHIERLLEKGIMIKGQPDTSVSNASSIVTIIESDEKRILLTGDACDRDLHEALTEQILLGLDTNFDLVKIPHHGSNSNNYTWLELIQAKYYLISTDNSKHGHPDIEVIANIILSSSEREKIICFNNNLEIISDIDDKALQEKYNYSIMKPNREWGIEIEL